MNTNTKTARRAASLLLAGCLAASGASATGYPVLDISNLMSGIERLYATYEEISNTVTQIQNTYTQIERAVKQVQSFDWSNVADAAKKYANSWSDLGDMSAWELLTEKDKVLATKSRLQDLTGSVSDSINVYTNVVNKLDETTVDVNGKKFSPLGLLGVGKHGDGTALSLATNTVAASLQNSKDVVDAFTKEMTPAQKRAVQRRYGIDGDTPVLLEVLDSTIDGDADVVIAAGSDLGQQLANNWGASRRQAEAAMETLAREDESMSEQIQALTLSVQDSNHETNARLDTLIKGYGVELQQKRREKMIEAVKAEQEVENEDASNKDSLHSSSASVEANTAG